MIGRGLVATTLTALTILTVHLAAPTTTRAEAERCPKMVAQFPPMEIPPAFRLAALQPTEVSLTYIGHSTFLIETPGGVTALTDYNDHVRPDIVPRVATMNHAHSTHYTNVPDPGIEHVLKGWADEDGTPARYNLDVGDLWVGNVPTNIRDYNGGTEKFGNSIFVFRAADLCIAHLGHLHHTLTEDDIAVLGRIDVVLAPVDGSYTLDVDGMVEVLKALEAPLVIPMHYFNESTLNRFLNRLGDSKYAVARNPGPRIILSRATLPAKPTVLVLPGH